MTLYKLCLLLFLLPISVVAGAQEVSDAPFLPPEGHALLIVGQDLGAIGGLDDYSDGYVDTVGIVPGGITSYTNIANLDGLTTVSNWGAGDVSAEMIVESDTYRNSVLAIGLWMSPSDLVDVGRGVYNVNIRELGTWMSEQERPIFLRIGYEFDGVHNAYEPDEYVIAYQHIVDTLDEQGVDNVAYVWQSATLGTTYLNHEWLDWYPGDDYVDWFGLSYFEPQPDVLNDFLDLARDHNKPVMIAESTPYGLPLDALSPAFTWSYWFEPYFAFIRDNNDVIRAVAYINVDWDVQDMWRNQGWGDSRIQANETISENWLAEIEDDFWLNASDDLFTLLNFEESNADE